MFSFRPAPLGHSGRAKQCLLKCFNYSVLPLRPAWMLGEACASCLSRQHTWATHGSVCKALSRAKLDTPAFDSDLPRWSDTVIPGRTFCNDAPSRSQLGMFTSARASFGHCSKNHLSPQSTETYTLLVKPLYTHTLPLRD